MTWVKVCGITTIAAMHAAETAGADAIGLVLHASSPRALTLDQATTIASRSSITSFIVTVDTPPSDAIALAAAIGADGVQNHGLHATEVANRAVESGLAALRPVAVDASGPLEDIDALDPAAYPLFDTVSARTHGGTGRTFDWAQIADVSRPFVVAGGLSAANVAALITSVRPYGVDASSQLEATPGVKDPDSIRAFIVEAKNA